MRQTKRKLIERLLILLGILLLLLYRLRLHTWR